MLNYTIIAVVTFTLLYGFVKDLHQSVVCWSGGNDLYAL